MNRVIPLAVPNLSGNEKKYLDNCIDTTFVSSVGEYVTRFESMVAEATGAKFAVATSAGTTALHAMLTAVGVGRDDLVIIPTFTFIASANAVAHCGASPWLFDIDPGTWCLDAELVEKKLRGETEQRDGAVYHKATGRRVAAIMPVYTLGNIPDMEKLRALADEYGLPLVVDAACAIGAKWKGKDFAPLADASALSFNGNKTITCGGGGMVVGNDEALMQKIRHLTTTARVNAEYDFDMVGFNYRMTNIQAAVGCAQMERLEEFLARKRAVRKFYRERLSDVDGVSLFPDLTDQESSCWFSGIVLDDGGIEKVRQVSALLKEKGVEGRTFWKPVHLQEPYRNAPRTEMPIAENLWDRIVTLPSSTNITDEELSTVVESVRRLFAG